MKMIQMRNVPDEIHLSIKIRAARRGVSMSDYLLELARSDLARPTTEEWLERVRGRGPVTTSVSSADIIREARGPLSL